MGGHPETEHSIHLDGWVKPGHDKLAAYMQPVGFGSPPILQACFAGP